MQPHYPSIVVSCAADGSLCKNDVNNPRFGSTSLLSTSLPIHMFRFDLDQPQILYTAEECGEIMCIDLRTSVNSCIYKSFKRLPIKALFQTPILGSNQLFVGGAGFKINVFDLRLISHHLNRRGVEKTDDNYAVCSFSPLYPSKVLDGRPVMDVDYYRNVSVGFSRSLTSSVSTSGLCLSKDGASFVASYQGDQIYAYDILPQTRNNENVLNNDDSNGVLRIGAKAYYGGHINYATFLKSVSFLGPHDEYIVSGSDSGHMWIWDTDSGILYPNSPSSNNPAEIYSKGRIEYFLFLKISYILIVYLVVILGTASNMLSMSDELPGQTTGISNCQLVHLSVAGNFHLLLAHIC
jgi:WD40 repeat protein